MAKFIDFLKFIKADYEFDKSNNKSKYYNSKVDQDVKDYMEHNANYNNLPEDKKKEIQQLGRKFAQEYIAKMLDLDDMVNDFQYDNEVNIPRGKFPEVFGLREKEYTAELEKTEKANGIDTGALIDHMLFDTHYKKFDKPEEIDEDAEPITEDDLYDIDQALNDYLSITPQQNQQGQQDKQEQQTQQDQQVQKQPESQTDKPKEDKSQG